MVGVKRGGSPTISRSSSPTNSGSPTICSITRKSRNKGGLKMWNLLEYVFGFFNTDGTPMMSNSPTDIEGKLFGQSNDDNSSIFSGAGFESDF